MYNNEKNKDESIENFETGENLFNGKYKKITIHSKDISRYDVHFPFVMIGKNENINLYFYDALKLISEVTNYIKVPNESKINTNNLERYLANFLIERGLEIDTFSILVLLKDQNKRLYDGLLEDGKTKVYFGEQLRNTAYTLDSIGRLIHNINSITLFKRMNQIPDEIHFAFKEIITGENKGNMEANMLLTADSFNQYQEELDKINIPKKIRDPRNLHHKKFLNESKDSYYRYQAFYLSYIDMNFDKIINEDIENKNKKFDSLRRNRSFTRYNN